MTNGASTRGHAVPDLDGWGGVIEEWVSIKLLTHQKAERQERRLTLP